MSYMQLKVAEYKNEKFVGFLELGRDFIYGGNFIEVWFEPKIREGLQIQISSEELVEEGTCQHYLKDEKDPLNRFGGIFNNRSYGEGRFILVKDGDFGVYEQKLFDKKHEEFGYGLSLDGKISCTFKNTDQFVGKYASSTLPKLIGNLIENPELWEKVK